MIREATTKIVDKGDLTYDEAYSVMTEIMTGQTTEIQNAAFLAALSTKRANTETIDEIAGCAAAVREHALPVTTNGLEVLDIVGTGGDGAHSFNISTTAALVVAAGGVPVAKHGNRAASSSCGTADCLEALGVNIDLEPEQCTALLHHVGMCFLFAQKYHASMKNVAAVRSQLGFPTVFNILGPLSNPTRPSMMLVGVYSSYLVEPIAQALTTLGVRRGMVVYGQDRLDEISLSAPTTICEFTDGVYQTYTLTPEDVGLPRCDRSELVGGSPHDNAAIVRRVLGGEPGAFRNAVVLNAGAALYLAGQAASCADGVRRAEAIIDSGAALRTLNALCKESQQ